MSPSARFRQAMRLPSKLLGCMRVGVGVGAVMLGGCDAIAEAKARVLGEDPAEVTAEAEAAADAPAAPVAEAPIAPEPMLLSRDGMAGVVEDTLARSRAAELGGDRPDARSSTVPPVEDLGRPRTEPEGSHLFVPFAGSGGVIAGATPTPEREVASSKPRTRPRPKLARPVEDEPCDPGISTPIVAPEREWSCGPCGRG
jgi:hypothetical protein